MIGGRLKVLSGFILVLFYWSLKSMLQLIYFLYGCCFTPNVCLTLNIFQTRHQCLSQQIVTLANLLFTLTNYKAESRCNSASCFHKSAFTTASQTLGRRVLADVASSAALVITGLIRPQHFWESSKNGAEWILGCLKRSERGAINTAVYISVLLYPLFAQRQRSHRKWAGASWTVWRKK